MALRRNRSTACTMSRGRRESYKLERPPSSPFQRCRAPTILAQRGGREFVRKWWRAGHRWCRIFRSRDFAKLSESSVGAYIPSDPPVALGHPLGSFARYLRCYGPKPQCIYFGFGSRNVSGVGCGRQLVGGKGESSGQRKRATGRRIDLKIINCQ